MSFLHFSNFVTAGGPSGTRLALALVVTPGPSLSVPGFRVDARRAPDGTTEVLAPFDTCIANDSDSCILALLGDTNVGDQLWFEFVPITAPDRQLPQGGDPPPLGRLVVVVGEGPTTIGGVTVDVGISGSTTFGTVADGGPFTATVDLANIILGPAAEASG
jgi:hypothetical protein